MKDTIALIANLIPLLMFLGTVIFTIANAIWKIHCEEKYNINKKYFSIPDKEFFLFVVVILTSMLVCVFFVIYSNYSDVIYNIDISDKNTSNSNVYDIIIEKNGYREKLTFDEDALELIDSKNFIKYRYEKLDSGKYRFVSRDNIKKENNLIKEDNLKKEPDEGYIYVTFDFNGGQTSRRTVKAVKKQVLIGAKISDAVAKVETDGIEKDGKDFAYWSDSKDKNSEYVDTIADDTLKNQILYAKYGEKVKVPDKNKTSLENGYKFVTFNFNDKNLKPVKLEVLEGVKISDAIEFLNKNNLAVDKNKDKPFNHLIDWSLSQDKLVGYEGKYINDSSGDNTDLYEHNYILEDYFNVYKLNDNTLIVVNNTKLNIFSRLVIILFIFLINFGANLKKIKKSYILCRNNYIIYTIIDLIIIIVSTYLFKKIIYCTYFDWIIFILLLFGLIMLLLNSNNKIILYTSMLVLSVCNTMIINITLNFFTIELFHVNMYYITLKNWIYTSVLTYCILLIFYSYVSIIKTVLKENTVDKQTILYEKDFKLGIYPRTLFAICEYQKKFLTVRYKISKENVLVLFTDEYWLVEPDDYYIEDNHYDKIKIVNCNKKKSNVCKTIEDDTKITLSSEQKVFVVKDNKTKEKFKNDGLKQFTLKITPSEAGKVLICGKLYEEGVTIYIDLDNVNDKNILKNELNIKGYPKKDYGFLGVYMHKQECADNYIEAKFIRNGSTICEESEIPEDFVKVKVEVEEKKDVHSKFYAVKKGTKKVKLIKLLDFKDKDKLRKELNKDNWAGLIKKYVCNMILYIKISILSMKKRKVVNEEKSDKSR